MIDPSMDQIELQINSDRQFPLVISDYDRIAWELRYDKVAWC